MFTYQSMVPGTNYCTTARTDSDFANSQSTSLDLESLPTLPGRWRGGQRDLFPSTLPPLLVVVPVVAVVCRGPAVGLIAAAFSTRR